MNQNNNDTPSKQERVTANSNNRFTAEEFHKMILAGAERRIKAEGKKPAYVVDQWNKQILWMLSLYFTDDPRFERNYPDMSLKKGIALVGPIGAGKTFIMSLFAENQKRSYVVRDCIIISEGYDWKPAYLVKYSTALSIPSANNHFNHQQAFGICFDDLGIEKTQKRYGNTCNVMANILFSRENKMAHHFTHITTNDHADEIGVKYGARLRSRFAGMFNHICFDENAPDRRKA